MPCNHTHFQTPLIDPLTKHFGPWRVYNCIYQWLFVIRYFHAALKPDSFSPLAWLRTGKEWQASTNNYYEAGYSFEEITSGFA